MQLLTPSQILTRPDPAWQFRPFWTHGALVTVFGKPGSFKTAIVKGWVFSMAAGVAWFDHPTTPGRVLWIAGEGHGGLKNRLLAWLRYHAVGALHGLGYCDETVPLRRGNPTLNAFLACASRFRPSMVVFDSFSDALRPAGLSDKHTEDMDVAIDAMKLLRDTLEATILVIHHTGWTSVNRARGGSNLYAAVDTEIEVCADKHHPYTARLVNTKQREAQLFATRTCALEAVDLGPNREGEPQSACVVRDVTTTTTPPPVTTPQPEPRKSGQRGGNKYGQLRAVRLSPKNRTH